MTNFTKRGSQLTWAFAFSASFSPGVGNLCTITGRMDGWISLANRKIN